MTLRKYSKTGPPGMEIDAEFRAILDTMFCACLPDSGSCACKLRKELFLRCDIEGQPLAEVAEALDLEIREARALVAQIRVMSRCKWRLACLGGTVYEQRKP
ncbi:hypothetical protein [Roseibium aggregatum]|uniref:hypothetical protein n=1 Tax=Roseibium aggregatum TaxID=187304 RepID=UPI001E3320E9|nr:hypothetical protein [Roseibium aggregatum]